MCCYSFSFYFLYFFTFFIWTLNKLRLQFKKKKKRIKLSQNFVIFLQCCSLDQHVNWNIECITLLMQLLNWLRQFTKWAHHFIGCTFENFNKKKCIHVSVCVLLCLFVYLIFIGKIFPHFSLHLFYLSIRWWAHYMLLFSCLLLSFLWCHSLYIYI